jgi:hypothetical protein
MSELFNTAIKKLFALIWLFVINHRCTSIKINKRMQYLLQDLIKLPLQDRLLIIEKLICTMLQTDYEKDIESLLKNSLKH